MICLCDDDVDGGVFSSAVILHRRQQHRKKFRQRQDIRNNRTDTYCDVDVLYIGIIKIKHTTIDIYTSSN